MSQEVVDIRVLVVEDVQRLAKLIASGLNLAGFSTECVHTATDARDAILEGRFDAIVLDLGLPDEDGRDLLHDLRANGVQTPILVLTARITVSDRVAGLDAGADDYLTKPFAGEELAARLRALLRRPATAFDDVLSLGNVTLSVSTRAVEVEGSPTHLTQKEAMLLEYLMRKTERVAEKTALEDSLFGASEQSANALEVLVHRLRQKLRAAGATATLHTVRGVGYMLTSKSEPAA